MARWCLAVEYDGSRYHGWQRQSHSSSVQQALEEALAVVADRRLAVFCAGRTDTGVHASGQIVHFDTAIERKPSAWMLGANSHLPDDISVRWARPVDDKFHARFSAVERRYRYLIANVRSRSALYARRAATFYEPLDEVAMQRAANYLLGEHDFSAFRAAGCQARHAHRTLRQLRVQRVDQWLVIDVAANAFLHHMVRNIVGMLVAVGGRAIEAEDAQRLLQGRDRTLAPSAAPSHGLYLTQVLYPDSILLPQPNAECQSLLPVYPLIPSVDVVTR